MEKHESQCLVYGKCPFCGQGRIITKNSLVWNDGVVSFTKGSIENVRGHGKDSELGRVWEFASVSKTNRNGKPAW